MADKEEAKEVKEAKKEGAGAKAPEKPKNKLKLIIIGVAAAVLLGGGGAGFMLMKGKSTASESAHEVKPEHEAEESAKGHSGSQGEEKGGHGAAKAVGGAVMKLEPFIVNLQDNSGTRYLKLTLNLELASNVNSSEIESQEARIRDSLIVLLSSKSYTDIGTVEGKYQLRDEIVARINQFLSNGKVKTAYFTEFVIQ